MAAVVALLALVAAIVPRLGNGSDDDSGAGGQALSGGAESAQDDPGAAGETAQSAVRGAAPGAAGLGAVDDEAELAERVEEALTREAAADAAAPAASRCEASFRAAGEALGALRLRAGLEWRGQPAEVFSDGRRAVVVDAGGCTELAAVDLD